MKILQKIKQLFIKEEIKQNPKECGLYKTIGCTHVDGKYCHYPNCSLYKEWEIEHKKKDKL